MSNNTVIVEDCNICKHKKICPFAHKHKHPDHPCLEFRMEALEPVVTYSNDPNQPTIWDIYMELLMAVSRKFPGETRHQTALRYIRETEQRATEPGDWNGN